MRQARIVASGSPQLQTALEANQITPYRAGEIAKLPSDQQEIALAQWVSRSRLRTRGHTIAATVIREELCRKHSRGSKVDLDRVVSAIKRAIIDFDR
jgi:hypothetical protein